MSSLLKISAIVLFILLVFLNFTHTYAESQNDGAEFVTVMLEAEDWPTSISEQRARTKELQDAALSGALSGRFDVVQRYETIPAMAGWMTTQSRDFVTSQARSDSSNVITAIDETPAGGTILPIEDGGSGALATSIPQISANRVHNKGFLGNNTEVAVIDTGIDLDHGDFAGAVVAQQCFCFNPGGNCCPNGSATQSGAGSAQDDNNHGSHVSGIVASRGNVSSVGVAPRTMITSVKALDANNGFFSTSDIVLALDWLNVNRPNLDAVNMSLGTFARFSDTCDATFSWTQALFTAVQNLVNKGVVVIASAGNDFANGSLNAPACLSNVVAIGAVNSSDQPAFFSNSDTNVELFAPGVSIVSDNAVGGLVTFSGTSMAAPHVAGTVALIREAAPNASRSNIISLLKSTGINVTDNFGLTRRRIDTYDAFCGLYQCTSASNGSGVNVSGGILLLLLDEEEN
ncbi:MAG: S8 family serine peptidase [Pseudomonadota bacterium]